VKSKTDMLIVVSDWSTPPARGWSPCPWQVLGGVGGGGRGLRRREQVRACQRWQRRCHAVAPAQTDVASPPAAPRHRAAAAAAAGGTSSSTLQPLRSRVAAATVAETASTGSRPRWVRYATILCSILLYGLEACPLLKSDLSSIDFVVNRLFMK